ncbi:MAG: hypothetical protein AB1297_03120 [bacterium]
MGNLTEKEKALLENKNAEDGEYIYREWEGGYFGYASGMMAIQNARKEEKNGKLNN